MFNVNKGHKMAKATAKKATKKAAKKATPKKKVGRPAKAKTAK